MNCRTCDYPLWDLKSRTCPECSTPFAPTQYQFRRHSVAFCCPNCDQPYYGAGEGGHLEPRGFTCIKCAQPVHEDMMVLRPTRGVDEEKTRYKTVPWFDTTIRSTVSRFVQTSMWALFLPGRLGARLPVPDRPWAAIGFAALGMGLMLIPAIALTLAIGIALSGLAGIGSVMFFALAIWAFAAIFPWAACTHIALVITGNRRAGFGKTLACHCYGMASCLPLAIPILSFYLVPVVMIYWTVVSAITIRSAQRVSWGRAITATLVFPVLLSLGVTALVLLLIIPAYNNAMASVASMQANTTPQQQATTLANAVFDHAKANSGAGPAHMIDLLMSNTIASPDLMSGIQYRSDARGSVNGRMLHLFDIMPDPVANGNVRKAVTASLPAAPITSHRLGDAVFVYHGIDLNAPADPGLWILVITTEPSPYAYPRPTTRPALGVAKADGTAIEIADADFIAALKEQNVLRANHALATLPDLRKIIANGFTTAADSPALDPPPEGP